MRSITRLCFCALCAVTTSLHPAERTTQTLCAADETPLFSCTVSFNHVVGAKLLAGNKTASVCASPDLSAASGYIKYRFGRPKNVEFAYPSALEHPRQHFRFFSDSGAKSSVEQLSFSNGAFSYIVFSERAAFDWNGSGVLVKRGGKLTAYFPCDQDRPPADSLYNLRGLGLPPADYDPIPAELQ